MSKPHPSLVDLAAGRPITSEHDPEGLYVSSVDHRMSGLLAADEIGVGSLTEHDRLHLAGVQASMWVHNTMLRERLREILSLASGVGAEVAAYKGVVTEERWYRQAGERVVTDLDLIVAPGSLDRALDLIAVIEPLRVDELRPLVSSGALQSCELRFQDITIDLHFDILKLELLETRDPHRLWESMEQMDAFGTQVLTPNPSLSLTLTLLHTTRDRFRWLSSYADVARIVQDGRADLGEALRLAESEGLGAQARLALNRIDQDLGLGLGNMSGKGVQYRIVSMLWPRVRSLSGTPLIHPPPRSTLKMAVLVKGRSLEAVRGWLLRLIPSRAVLDHYHPDVRGPYLIRLVSARFGRRLAGLKKRFRR
jgi:hypothetical protein